MIDHVGFEVSDLARSARFYDAIFCAARRAARCSTSDGRDRLRRARAASSSGSSRAAARRRPAYGHVALSAHGRAAVDAAYAAALGAGGRDDGPPGPRPQYGPTYYAAYLLDPDGLRVEVVSGAH